MLVLVVPVACSRHDDAGPQGVVIGWNEGVGIFAVDVQTGRRTMLIPAEEGHYYELPAFDAQANVLYFVDRAIGAVCAWKGGEDAPSRLYEYDSKRYMACPPYLSPSGKLLGFVISSKFKPETPSRLVVYDVGRRAVVHSRDLDGTMAVGEFLGEGSLIVSVRAEHGTKYDRLGQYEYGTGRLDLYPDNVLIGRLLPGANALMVWRREGGRSVYYVQKLDTGEIVRKVDDRNLPGDEAYMECSVNDRYVIVQRERGRVWALGMYLLDMETGRARKISSYHPREPIFVPGTLRWSPGRPASSPTTSQP